MSGTGFLSLANGWAPNGSAAAIISNSGTGQAIVTIGYTNRSVSTATLTFWRNGTTDPHGIGSPILLNAGDQGWDDKLIVGPGDVIYALCSAASAVALDITLYQVVA
nr:hypothetical protein [uncultured Rhodopila sp.]